MGFTSVNLKSSLIVSLAFATALLCFDAGVSANWSSEEPQNRKHIVRPGETLSVIARNYGFEAKELVQYNKMSNPARLQVGQVIYFPGEPTDKSQAALPAEAMNASPGSLNATQFPPDSAKPSPEEYYQLQQFMGASGPIKPTNDVDYNFIQKQKPPLEEPILPKGFGVPEADVKAMEAVADEIMASEQADPEENIDDRESPALSAFGERPYAYFGNGEELVDVIQNFAASYYIPTSIAEDVFGEVNGKIGPLTPVDFMDHMANIYGFIWYFDGHTLYVYSGSSAEQRIISLSNMSVEQFKKTLKKVGIWDGRFYWKAQQKDGLVFVSGPPRYVEMVSQTALLLDEKEGERLKSQLTVRMFPLKYAWASDKKFPFRGQEITVPGVATLLESIISGGGVANINNQPLPNPSLKGLQGATLAGARKAKEKAEQKAADEANTLNAGASADSVYISADARLNSVIVHDLESKMPMYEDLIKSLDKPTSQIEVSVSIIDIDTTNIDALGLEWSKGKGTDKEISFNGNLGALAPPTYTTIIQTEIGAFNAKLELLARENKAKVISRPSILTLDNLEAVLDNSSTFYVSVSGERDAELFPVTSGTVVQVTPRIVREESGRRIHMNVNIQDGSGSQGGTDASPLPSIKNSSISTQAIIHEQESLLVGGFYKESENETSSKVPLLGDIPILGRLFRAEQSEKIKQVRLFLITPRIVGIERS